MPNMSASDALTLLKSSVLPAQFGKNAKAPKTFFNNLWQVAFRAEIFFGILLIIKNKPEKLQACPLMCINFINN